MSGVLRKLKLILDMELNEASTVFILGHNSPDFDSLGSALGLYILAASYNKEIYIIVENVNEQMQKIIANYKSLFNIITKEEYEKLKNNNSLIIMSDVNKKNLIPIPDIEKQNVIIIDHHTPDENTVKTNNIFIDNKASSASEIITQILCSLHLKIPREVANLLLAGIVLDTKRFKVNTNSKTHDVAEKLLNFGADANFVNELFLDKYENYCKINNLVINFTKVKKYSDPLLPIQVSFTLNRKKPRTIYKKEELAKVADTMMKFEFDAAFVMGFISPGEIAISARSYKNVNVAEVITEIVTKIHGSGGGDACRAAGTVKAKNIIQIEEEIMNIVEEAIERQEVEKVELPKELSEEGLLLEIKTDPEDELNPSIAVQRIKTIKNS